MENLTPLSEIESVVRRGQAKSPVLTPSGQRVRNILGQALLLLSVVSAIAPLLLPRQISWLSMALVVSIFASLTCSRRGSKLWLRFPKSRKYDSPFEEMTNLYGPYTTSEIVAMSFYAHQCAAEARDCTDRKRKQLLRMCRDYFYCPRIIQWVARPFPKPKTILAKPGTATGQQYLFFGSGVGTEGTRIANTWSHTYHILGTVSDADLSKVERATRLWCEAAYKIFRYERDLEEKSLDGLGTLFAELQLIINEIGGQKPVQGTKTATFSSYREWVVVSIMVAAFWIAALMVGKKWPSALPACLMSALIGTGAVVLSGWNLHASRKRSERVPTHTPNLPLMTQTASTPEDAAAEGPPPSDSKEEKTQ